MEKEKLSAAERLDKLFCNEEKNAGKSVCSTGLHSVDAALGGGLYPGVTTITGVPGAGKTTFATQVFANSISNANLYSYFVSLDMPASSIRNKILSWASTIEAKDISGYLTANDIARRHQLFGQKEETLEKVIDRFLYESFFNLNVDSPHDIYGADYLKDDIDMMLWSLLEKREISIKEYERWHDYDERGNEISTTLKVAQIAMARERAYLSKQAHGGLVVVDYLQLAQDGRYPNEETGRITAVMNEMREWSRQQKDPPLAILAISSLSRTGFKDPTALASMSGSSAIEYGVEAAMVLEEDQVYKPAQKEAMWMQERGITRVKLSITKNRNGSKCTEIPLWFDGAHNRFIEPKAYRATMTNPK